MLVIPEYLKPLVSDYRMNLIQVRQSESLCFRNQDISIVFDMIRSIYNKDYETLARTVQYSVYSYGGKHYYLGAISLYCPKKHMEMNFMLQERK